MARAAACGKPTSAGREKAFPASDSASSAKPPQPAKATTRSPGASPRTSAPTSFTTPANSLPGEKGSSGLSWYFPWMTSVSGKFTPAARTDTSTCRGPGRGDGTSSSASPSGGPSDRHRTAFTAAPRRSSRLREGAGGEDPAHALLDGAADPLVGEGVEIAGL